MKAIYKKPEIYVTEMDCEQTFLTGSAAFNVGIDNDSNLENEADMWSNQESDLNVW